MKVNRVDNSLSFKSVYKLPNAKKVDILKFEDVVAPLCRSNMKKCIRGIDTGAKGFFALTEADAIEFDRYYSNIQRKREGFLDIFKENVTDRMYNVIEVLNNRDHVYTNNFLATKSPKVVDSFLELTKEIFKK